MITAQKALKDSLRLLPGGLRAVEKKRLDQPLSVLRASACVSFHELKVSLVILDKVVDKQLKHS